MPHKILLVDDSLLVPRLNETHFLRQFASSDILVAPRGADAFDRLLIAEPDVVVVNDSLPDMDGEAVCHRLLDNPLTSHLPVILLSGDGAKPLSRKYANVSKTIQPPVDSDTLSAAVSQALSDAKPKHHPAAAILFRDPAHIVFSGHTVFFTLRAAMQMAYGDRLTGALRVFLNRYPVELFFAEGRFLFATTRNAQLYAKDSTVILSSTNLGLIVESQASQAVNGCPMFLFLATRSGFPHDDVVQITRDHGQRVFSYLFTAGRINFEFEEMPSLPEYARNFPPGQEDPDNWLLSSLRHVKFDTLTAQQRPDPNGNPNYTRKGYELIQRLRLNDVEARFAALINGSSSLQQIAKKLGLALNDALLIVFRFQVLEIIDYWSSSYLSLPAAAPASSSAA